MPNQVISKMEQKHSFNLTSDFLSGFTGLFVKLVFLIVVVYLIVLLVNFFRDKYINRPADPKKEEVADLLAVLNKVFLFSGFGFIIANIIQFLLNQVTSGGNTMMNFRGDWDYLTFGIILIFVGISFRSANKTIRASRIE